jgi:hypothetical protein
MTFARALVYAIAASGLVVACADTTPIDYKAPVEDAAAADGAAGPDAGLIMACRQCLTTGACQAQTATCMQDTECAPLLNCLMDAYCLNYVASDTSRPCLIRCAINAGITSQTDPAVNIYIPVYLCAQGADTCGAECNVQ